MYEIFLTLIGGLFGWLISHIYAKRSSEDQTLRFDNMEQYLKRIENHVRPTLPELANQISMALKTGNFTGVEPGVFAESDPCPKCGKKSLKFTNWGNGPLGQSNAWYQCTNCDYRFQTTESSSD